MNLVRVKSNYWLGQSANGSSFYWCWLQALMSSNWSSSSRSEGSGPRIEDSILLCKSISTLVSVKAVFEPIKPNECCSSVQITNIFLVDRTGADNTYTLHTLIRLSPLLERITSYTIRLKQRNSTSHTKGPTTRIEPIPEGMQKEISASPPGNEACSSAYKYASTYFLSWPLWANSCFPAFRSRLVVVLSRVAISPVREEMNQVKPIPVRIALLLIRL